MVIVNFQTATTVLEYTGITICNEQFCNIYYVYIPVAYYWSMVSYVLYIIAIDALVLKSVWLYCSEDVCEQLLNICNQPGYCNSNKICNIKILIYKMYSR